MINTHENNRICIGTVGFDYPEWGGHFYDSDLPDDWRFLHYCNQFRSLLVSSERTAEYLSGRLPELNEDSDPGFQFIFSVSGEDVVVRDISKLIRKFNALPGRVTGLVVELSDGCEDGGANRLLTGLQEIEAYCPLCLDCGHASVPLSDIHELVRGTNASWVWRPSIDGAPQPSGQFLVTRLGSVSLKETRLVLEACAHWAGEGRNAGIFFENVITATDQARDCRIMAEMMGV